MLKSRKLKDSIASVNLHGNYRRKTRKYGLYRWRWGKECRFRPVPFVIVFVESGT